MEQIIAPIVVPSVSTKTAHALMVKTIVLRLMPRLVLLLFMAFLPQELPLLTGLSTKTVLILQHLHQKVNRIYEIIPQTKRNSPPRELWPRPKVSKRAIPSGRVRPLFERLNVVHISACLAPYLDGLSWQPLALRMWRAYLLGSFPSIALRLLPLPCACAQTQQAHC